MPIDQSKLDRMIRMVDDYLSQRDDDEDRDTDPVEFQETLSTRRAMPVAEPPDPLTDGAPQRIHGAGRRDLFK
jgi:hypothetical protein